MHVYEIDMRVHFNYSILPCGFIQIKAFFSALVSRNHGRRLFSSALYTQSLHAMDSRPCTESLNQYI